MAHFSNFGKTYNKALMFLSRFRLVMLPRPKCILDFIFLAVRVKICKYGLLFSVSYTIYTIRASYEQ